LEKVWREALNLKYGKLPPQFHPKTLKLEKYLIAASLPLPEERRGWEYAVPDSVWAASMLGNDQYGDCVIAMILHYIMLATAAVGTPVTFTTKQALDLYSAITGFDPSDPSTDQGTVMTSAMAYWQKTGACGHKILGWASFDYTNLTKLRQAIDIFGAALVGTNVVQSMEDDFAAGRPWNNFTGPSVGGHGIPLPGFGRDGQTCITWAKRQQMSPAITTSQFDEAYVVITDDFMDKAGKTPLGVNINALNADLKLISA
jgi:hypothetical protein